LEAKLIFRVATALLSIAFASGLVMAGIRFATDKQSPVREPLPSDDLERHLGLRLRALGCLAGAPRLDRVDAFPEEVSCLPVCFTRLG
jgi:hypothetical protein